MEYYLGVDQSLRSPGICVLEEGTHRPVFLTHVPTGKARGGERLAMIYDQVVYVVKRWKPVQGAMEGYSIESVNRPFDLGEAGGMVKLACHQHAVPLITVPPTSLKKFAGNAKADKEGVAKLVAQKWQQHIDQNDECDAYVLAQVARALKHQEAVTVRAELEVLKKLLQEPGLALVSYTPRSINT